MAEHLFGQAVGVHVGGVEERHAVVQAQVDHALRLLALRAPPPLEEGIAAAEGGGAQAERRHLQARVSESSVFHHGRVLIGR